MIDTFGTGKIDEKEISERVKKVFGTKPSEIISTLNLLRPVFQPTASYGHFGRTGDSFTWENTDKAASLK